MKRCFIPLIGLVLVLSLIPALTGVSSQPDMPTLRGELRVGKRYHFVPIGKDYSDQGALVEVLAIDQDWIKVKTGLIESRYVWINLHGVGAIKTTEKVEGGNLNDDGK